MYIIEVYTPVYVYQQMQVVDIKQSDSFNGTKF